MKEFFQIAGQVAGLAGIALVVFLMISRVIVSKTRDVNQSQSFKLLNRLLILAATITALGMVLWVISLAIGSDQAVQLKTLEIRVAEIAKVRDRLQRNLEDERKRTSDLIELTRRLTDSLDAFSREHSEDDLTIRQSEVISEANATRQSALAELERRLGGRSASLARLRSIHSGQEFSVANTLILASFSLRMYRSDASQATHDAVISTMRGLEADILAIQEVADEGALARLMESLPDYKPVLGKTNSYPFRSVVLYHKDRVALLHSEELRFDGFAAPRKPLVAEFETQGIRWLFVNLHLKSNYGGVPQNVERRLAATRLLAEWIQDQANQSVIVAGVFQCGAAAPEMQPLLNVEGDVVTDELSDDTTTLITDHDEWRGVYSHFVFFGPIRHRYIDRSVRVHNLEELLPELTRRAIRDSISDHSPISIAITISG